jgi:hypothetical protein
MTTYIDQAVAREICPDIDSVSDPFGPASEGHEDEERIHAQRMV